MQSQIPFSQPLRSTNCLKAISIAPLFLSRFAFDPSFPAFLLLLSTTTPPCAPISPAVAGLFDQACIRARHSRGVTHSRIRSCASGLRISLARSAGDSTPFSSSRDSFFRCLDDVYVPDCCSLLPLPSFKREHHQAVFVARCCETSRCSGYVSAPSEHVIDKPSSYDSLTAA